MSCNSQFVNVLASHEYETFTFPKEILYDESLSGNAIKLLLIILDFGKRPNWKLWQSHLMAISGMGQTKYDNAIKNLEKSGYVQRFRGKIKGKWLPYVYKFSAFPIFKNSEEKNHLHVEKKSDPVFQYGLSILENPNYTSSSNINVLEETTNYQDSTNLDQQSPSKKINLVSSSFEKLKELEEIRKISTSQKKTLYSKYTHEQIKKALKTFKIESVDSVFAMIISSIKNNYDVLDENINSNAESIRIYREAEEFLLLNNKSTLISLAIDEKNAYILMGSAKSVYALNDPDFKDKFVKAINTKY